MKRFLTKIFTFLLVAGGLFYAVCKLALLYPTAFESIGYSEKWFKVYRIASKSKEKIASDTIFIGDSVGAQFFPYTDGQNYMPINGAILMPGQYIIAANTIASNPDLKCIVVVCSPISLGSKFGAILTCNNFVKPFYQKENFKHITPSLRQKIEAKPFAWFYQFPVIKFLPFSDVNYIDGPEEPYDLSEVSEEYLKKLIDLCESQNVAIKFVSPPLKNTLLVESDNWSVMKTQLKVAKLDSYFQDYFKNIEYLEQDKFIEGIHLKHHLVENYRSNLLLSLNKIN